MADNVAITAGAGTTIAADDVSAVLYQRVKLTPGPDGIAGKDVGGRNVDGGSTDAALFTDPRILQSVQSQDSAGLTTSVTAYTAGDVLGTGWTFTSMVRASGGHGRIVGLRLLDITDITSTVEFYFSTGSITFGTDNAAPSISDADAAKLVPCPVTVSMVDLGGCRIGAAYNLSIPYTCDATSLFVYAISRVAHTFFAAVGDLKLQLFYEQL